MDDYEDIFVVSKNNQIIAVYEFRQDAESHDLYDKDVTVTKIKIMDSFKDWLEEKEQLEIRQKALAKLTKEEKEVLGLT